MNSPLPDGFFCSHGNFIRRILLWTSEISARRKTDDDALWFFLGGVRRNTSSRFWRVRSLTFIPWRRDVPGVENFQTVSSFLSNRKLEISRRVTGSSGPVSRSACYLLFHLQGSFVCRRRSVSVIAGVRKFVSNDRNSFENIILCNFDSLDCKWLYIFNKLNILFLKYFSHLAREVERKNLVSTWKMCPSYGSTLKEARLQKGSTRRW